MPITDQGPLPRMPPLLLQEQCLPQVTHLQPRLLAMGMAPMETTTPTKLLITRGLHMVELQVVITTALDLVRPHPQAAGPTTAQVTATVDATTDAILAEAATATTVAKDRDRPMAEIDMDPHLTTEEVEEVVMAVSSKLLRPLHVSNVSIIKSFNISHFLDTPRF